MINLNIPSKLSINKTREGSPKVRIQEDRFTETSSDKQV